MAESTTPRTRQLALVTGASSGIGLELARLFAQNDYDLVIAAEDASIDAAATELRAMGGAVEAMQVDLATRDGVERLAARFGSDRRAPDAIALNAGVGLGKGFLDQDLDEIFNVIDTNVCGTVHLAYRVLPGMVAQGRGRVLFTSSIAARMPGSFQAIYNASKAFVQSFAEAIRNELKDTGVTVTALQPGPTDTNFFARAGMEDTKVGQDHKDDPAEVAKQGFEAMLDGKDHVIAGSFKVKAQAAMAQVTPETTKAQMHRKQAEPGSGSN
ncbi:MAG TPA: SDR family NAD(P)-dependent oxidoreductase [Gemmatimonadaceae bacterium]|jgi:short-subunit dehydrogenase|nr:SDR family NAD(P)-dependent oxidoreductase [Gemmatimonadaceae bacterium]